MTQHVAADRNSFRAQHPIRSFHASLEGEMSQLTMRNWKAKGKPRTEKFLEGKKKKRTTLAGRRLLELTGIWGKGDLGPTSAHGSASTQEASRLSVQFAVCPSDLLCRCWVLLAKKDQPQEGQDSLSVHQGLSTQGAIVFESAAQI